MRASTHSHHRLLGAGHRLRHRLTFRLGLGLDHCAFVCLCTMRGSCRSRVRHANAVSSIWRRIAAALPLAMSLRDSDKILSRSAAENLLISVPPKEQARDHHSTSILTK